MKRCRHGLSRFGTVGGSLTPKTTTTTPKSGVVMTDVVVGVIMWSWAGRTGLASDLVETRPERSWGAQTFRFGNNA